MKKLIFTLCIILTAIYSQAQIQGYCAWHENFDLPSLDDSVNSYSSNPPANAGWSINSRLQVSPTNCDSAYVTTGDTLILTTDTIDVTGMNYVQLNFDHIAKINFFDVAIIEVSPCGGCFWFQATCSEYLTDDSIPPGAPFCAQNNQFSAASYATWLPANDTAIPDNGWWKHEIFDISAFALASNELQIRFVLFDSNIPGGAGNNGWKIDNICVSAFPCEIIKPVVTQLPIIWQNTVYNLGPYPVNVDASDNSGLASVILNYTINPGGTTGSVVMVNTSGNTYNGQIPAVNDGDTVCYYVVATDASACANQDSTPLRCFVASAGITFPYCDNFDFQNLWSDSTIAPGSTWQLGTPAYGYTTGAHSPPNAWDINLNSAYGNNANAYLYSPVFGTIIPNAKLEFWHKWATEQSWDGTRIEYSTDGGFNWALLGDFANTCGCQVNWYNMATIISSNMPAWAGTSGTVFPPPASNNGWVHSEYTFNAGFPFGPSIQFRAVFTSDASVIVDGYSIDDWCISLPQPEDAGVPVIIQPGVSAPAGSCQDVTVTLKNFGINTLTAFDVYYTVNTGGGPVAYGPYPWTGNLASGATTTFTMPCLTIPQGAFTLCSYTSLTTDGNHFNDTSCTNIVGIPVLTISSCDDMEAGNIGYLTTSQFGNTQWQIGTPAWGVTTGAHSGVNAWDVNLTSPYTTNDTCALFTPIYDVAGAVNPSFSFWQNRNLGQFDGLRVDYTCDNGVTWQILWSGIVPAPPTTAINWYNTASVNFTVYPGWIGSSNGWIKSTYFLNDVLIANGNPNYIQFRFVFKSSFNVPLDGVSVDDICVTQPGAFDAGVIQINTPAQGTILLAASTSPVAVTFLNYGSSTIDTCNVTWALNGVPQGTLQYIGNIAPGATSPILTLNGTLTVPSGQFTICAYTQLIADGDTTNDTTCVDYIGVPTIPISFTNSYCDDFESGNVGWTNVLNPTGDPGTIWQLGAPIYGTTSSAHSGINAWDINLASAYTNNADVTLYTPFFDFSNANDTKLSFWRNHNTETSWDGVRIEYTLNGATWNLIGGITSPPPYINWYTNNVICSNLPAWAGNSGGWIQSTMGNLGQLVPSPNGAGMVQFRFTFCSDASVILDGFSIDDFCLEVPVPLTAAPTSITNSSSGFPCIFEGQSVTFATTIKNKGTTPITTLNATLIIDGTPVVTDSITYAPALAPGATQPHPFTFSWIATPGSHNICVATSSPNGQVDLNPTDDTICKVLQVCDTVGISLGGSYCNDFENPPNWATFNAISYSAPTSWQIGAPAQTCLNAAHSGTTAWMTRLTLNYPNRDTSGLFTPVFNVLGGEKYKLSFWHMYRSELYADGGTIDYSTDYGNSWTLLGAAGGTSWYNSFYITGLGGMPPAPGWSGILCTYQYREHEICFTNNATVMFRFRFMSDFTVNDEGWVIDDFCFADMNVTCPVGISELNDNSGFALGQNYPNPANGTTTIEYSIPENGNVQMSIISMVGQTVDIVVRENQDAGRHYVTFNTGNLSPGIYYYELIYEKQRLVKKMVIVN